MDTTRVIISVPANEIDWFIATFIGHYSPNIFKIEDHYRPLTMDNLRRDINEQEKETPQQ